jgi:outer membrane protein assembly factor BamB
VTTAAHRDTPGDSVIDLGTVSPAGDRPLPVGRVRGRWRSPRSRRHRRWLATLAAVGLLPIGTVTAAEPERRFAQLVFALPVAGVTGMTLDQRALYTMSGTGPDGGPPTLSAYELRDGSRRWRVPLPGAGEASHLRPALSDVLIVSGIPDGQTTAYDPHTGAQLWSRPGWPDAGLRGQVLLHPAAPVAPGSAVVATLTSVEPRTGDVRWRVPLQESMAYGDSDHPYLLSLTGEGELTSYHLVTGRRLATVDAGAGAGGVSLAGGVALVRAAGGGPLLSLAAYALPDLTHLWTVEAADHWITDCGVVICLNRLGRPAGLDPHTGQVRWSAQWLPPTGLHYASRPSHPSLADHLFVSSEDQALWLVEAATGRPVLDLRGWEPMWPHPWGAAAAGGGAEVVVVRQAGGIVWFGRLRADLTGVDTIGGLHSAGGSCGVAADYVACLRDDDEQLQVWRRPGRTHRLAGPG